MLSKSSKLIDLPWGARPALALRVPHCFADFAAALSRCALPSLPRCREQ